MMPLEIDNPFWQFSLRVYGAPGVAEECLEVQDKLGADVNVVLYAVWLGAVCGRILDDGDLTHVQDAVGAWSARVVQPLRKVRREIRTMHEASDSQVQELRKRIADAELLSEQIEQALLFRQTDSIGRPGVASVAAAHENVSCVLARHGADGAGFPLRKLFAASAAVQA